MSSSGSASASTSTSLNLKAADILARARKAAGQPEEEEIPQIFSDEILDDMQEALLLLENRVKGGPGSLSVHDVKNLEQRLDRIIFEMNDFMINGNEFAQPITPASVPQVASTAVVAPPPAPVVPVVVPPPVPVPPPVVPSPVPPPVVLAPPPAPVPPPMVPTAIPTTYSTTVSSTVPMPMGQQQAQERYVHEHNSEEGAPYEGKGGLGLASGTTNTWLIDGMDEMTGEEYRRALQASVSARQADRRNRNPNIGNRMSNNYLDSL